MALSALDENGNPVDWWFIYKVPHLNKGANNDQAKGYEYVYFDPNMKEVAKSAHTLDDGAGALNRTLDSILKQADSAAGWILYNDERPDDDVTPDDANLGHTKGVLAFDLESDTAFWLLHSWPKFADSVAKTSPASTYGQTYLCLTLNVDTARKIAAQMATHQEPQVYKTQLPKGLKAKDEFFALSQKIDPATEASSNVIDLTTLGGMAFKAIAKNRRWNDDFWNDLVGPKLGADINVESWIRGPIPPVADSDGIHKTFDIKYINLGALGIHYAWPETYDHAKWGITVTDDWVCVGDINRMISQRKRGGGTIAFKNRLLWTALLQTTLVLAPPGHTRDEARTVIHRSHTKAALAAGGPTGP